MTATDAIRAVEEMCRIGLYGVDFMQSLKPERIASACNGIGPEAWPKEMRERLDKWLATFRLAADVHDCRFTFDNNGTREKFDYANDELEKNCKILADEKYSWWNPRRYFARNAAHLVGDACRSVFGWKAYGDAYFKKTTTKEQTR